MWREGTGEVREGDAALQMCLVYKSLKMPTYSKKKDREMRKSRILSP